MFDLSPEETAEPLDGGLSVICAKRGYRFTEDAVFLARHAVLKKNDRVCDLGTGNGVIPLLMCVKEPTARFVGVELQAAAADRARRSVAGNGITSVEIVEMSMQDAPSMFGQKTFDLVTANPPYHKCDGNAISVGEEIALSKYELGVKLSEVIEVASRLLSDGGRFFVVMCASRLPELVGLLLANRLQPKKMYFKTGAQGAVTAVVVAAVKGGKPGLDCICAE